MAAMTRKEVEQLVAETLPAKVEQILADKIPTKVEQLITDIMEAKVKSEVGRRLQESVQGLQASVDEGQKLHQRMMGALQRYAEQVPHAERICEALGKQLEPSHLQSKVHNPSAPDGHGSLGPVLYRNIKYPDGPAAFNALRLDVYDAPSVSASRRASLEFGALLPVAATQQVGQALWLELAQGAVSSGRNLQGFWVQATRDDGTVQCAEVKGGGRPEPVEYFGQTFGRFYTEGFDGPRDAVVLSASGQAFWPTLNLTCMLRGIAMATVFEQDWADGSDGFAVWVPYYAVNVYRFGLAGRQKQKYITVKPTANWRRYAGPQGTWVPDAENVKGDIGRAQYCECHWLFGMSRKLGFMWEDVTFVTTLSFLRAQCNWTEEECIEECLVELEKAHQDFHTLDEDEMERTFFTQLFSTEEALGFADLQAELGVDQVDRKAARDSANPVPWSSVPAPKPDQAARALDSLRGMLRLWMGSRDSYFKTLAELKLQPADLTDLGILTNSDRNMLHAAARTGQSRVLRGVLDELRKAKVLRDWLIRPNQHQQTPLHVALAAQQGDAAAILLREVTDSKQLGQLLEMADVDGQSLMHLAVSASNQEVICCASGEGDLSWVNADLLSHQNPQGKTLLDLCRDEESVLTALLAVAINFKEARRWLELQLFLVRRSGDAAQLDYLRRLLQQRDNQGQQLLSSVREEEQAEVLEDLALSYPMQGLSLQLDYGVRIDNDTVVVKALDTGRAKDCLQKVLQDLVVHGTQDALRKLLRQNLTTRSLADWNRRESGALQVRRELDSALLGQMLGTLHTRGCLSPSELEVLQDLTPQNFGQVLSLELPGEIVAATVRTTQTRGCLHQVLQGLTPRSLGQVLSVELPEEIVAAAIQTAQTRGCLRKVLQGLTPQSLGHLLSMELPEETVAAAVRTAQTEGCLREVYLYAAKAAPSRTIPDLVAVLGELNPRSLLPGFIQALLEAGRLEEATLVRMLCWCDGHATRIGLAAGVLAAGRFQEVARGDVLPVLRCIESCVRLGKLEIVGDIMAAVRAAGRFKEVLKAIFHESLTGCYGRSHGEDEVSRLIAAAHAADGFKKVVRRSSQLQLSCLVRSAQEVCKGEILDDLVKAVRRASRLVEVEVGMRTFRLSA